MVRDFDEYSEDDEEIPKPSKKDLLFKDLVAYNKIPDITKLASLNDVYAAYMKLRSFVSRTNIQRSMKLSEKFKANIYFKRVLLILSLFFYLFYLGRLINSSFL